MDPKKMDAKVLQRGIEEAEKELNWIRVKLAEMQPLDQRRAVLEAYVAQAKVLLGTERAVPEEVISPPKPVRRITPTKDRPIWSGAREVLAEAKHPMNAGEITQELLNRGWRLGRWGSEIVRAGMSRKQDVFERVSPGLYALKEWPDNLKHP